MIKDEPASYFNDRRNLHIKILFSVSGCEAEGSFARQHVFVCVFRGFGVALESKCSRRVLNRGGVFSLRMPAPYEVSLPINCKAHATEATGSQDEKYISNSSSVLMLKYLRHVWLWLYQEKSNLCS